MRFWTRLAVLAFCCVAPAAIAESVFSFNNVATGQSVPFSLSVNGLTASFDGNAAVCPTTGLSGSMFISVTGNAIMQGFCGTPTASRAPLSISFSDQVGKLTFGLAINGTTPAPVTVTYLQNGTVVGTQTIQPVVPNGSLSPEAVVSYSGGFNAVTLSSTALLAFGNLDAVPVPPAGR